MSVMEEYKQSKERAIEKAADSLKEHEDAIHRLQERMDSIRQWAKDVNEMMKEKTNRG